MLGAIGSLKRLRHPLGSGTALYVCFKRALATHFKRWFQLNIGAGIVSYRSSTTARNNLCESNIARRLGVLQPANPARYGEGCAKATGIKLGTEHTAAKSSGINSGRVNVTVNFKVENTGNRQAIGVHKQVYPVIVGYKYSNIGTKVNGI